MNDTILGAIIGLASSLCTLIIKEVFDVKKSTKNQQYELKKEFLALTRTKAEEILKGVQIYSEIVDEMLIQIQCKTIDWSKLSTEYINEKFQGQKEKTAIYLSLYFPDLDKQYLTYSLKAIKLNNQIAATRKGGQYTSKELDKINKLYKEFLKAKLSLTGALVREIRNKNKQVM